MNTIAPIIGVSTQSVMRWIRVHGDAVSMPEAPAHAVEVEMDEMHHFLQKKMKNFGSGKCWIITPAPSWDGFAVIVLKKPESV